MGSLTGTVTDDRGESLPGATIFLPQIQRGAATDIDGAYRILGVPVVVYEVTFSSVGFQRQTLPDVQISRDQPRQVDVTLSPGQGMSEIVVEYEPPCTDCARLGVLEWGNAEIWNLPVRGQHPFPGALPWPPAPRR